MHWLIVRDVHHIICVQMEMSGQTVVYLPPDQCNGLGVNLLSHFAYVKRKNDFETGWTSHGPFNGLARR